ncbi:MAG: hypothetical protein LBM72_02250 [Mycoplasmataceae bacterium]|jgi:hypothetical protein|nr:hypothetical protein [Mycoplasmataceae bacterium]
MNKLSKNQIISLCVGGVLGATAISVAGVVISQAVKHNGLFEDKRVDIAFESGANTLAYGGTDVIQATFTNVVGNCEWHFTIEDQQLHYDHTIISQTHDGIEINSFGDNNSEISFVNTSNQYKPIYIQNIYATVDYQNSNESITITALPALIK